MGVFVYTDFTSGLMGPHQGEGKLIAGAFADWKDSKNGLVTTYDAKGELLSHGNFSSGPDPDTPTPRRPAASNRGGASSFRCPHRFGAPLLQVFRSGRQGSPLTAGASHFNFLP
ncbi:MULTISPECIES: hypothetical protein [Streptomyces]|uniref:Uncharacterized protein n=1 Tax=Streptomyces siderophoricus TaxID=2802281 RepID=A0ABS1N317_9ACTN|nr:hypothetical protein [Streptomyces sp. 9-7]MBL1094459.1 hypothetical protein [Streptomyces sp. 9-7]